MDWKLPRERRREDKGPWPLCGSDRGRSMGKTARTLASFEREGWAASGLADKLQGVCDERLSPAAPQEVEGLNRSDDDRTNRNTPAFSVRELRIGRSHTGSAPEASRRQSAITLEERGEPPSVGLERHLQDGRRRQDHRKAMLLVRSSHPKKRRLQPNAE